MAVPQRNGVLVCFHKSLSQSSSQGGHCQVLSASLLSKFPGLVDNILLNTTFVVTIWVWWLISAQGIWWKEQVANLQHQHNLSVSSNLEMKEANPRARSKHGSLPSSLRPTAVSQQRSLPVPDVGGRVPTSCARQSRFWSQRGAGGSAVGIVVATLHGPPSPALPTPQCPSPRGPSSFSPSSSGPQNASDLAGVRLGLPSLGFLEAVLEKRTRA